MHDAAKQLSTRSVLTLRPFFRAAEARGVRAAEVLSELGLPPDALDRDEARLETALAGHLVARLAERCPGVALGLVAAEDARLGELGLFDYVTSSASTVREACVFATEFYKLLDQASHLALEERDHEVAFVLNPCDDPVRIPMVCEFAFATIARTMREISRRDLRASEVRFRHKPCTDARVYERHFRTQVTFCMPRHEFIFPRAYLGLALPSGSTATHDAVKERARAQLESEPPPMSFVDEVRQEANTALMGGRLSLHEVAARLRTSARTLQRRLRAHGTSFDAIVEESQRDLAVHLVAHGTMPIAEIAHRVGYFNAGAFARAFRRWTRTSPRDYRAHGPSAEAAPDSVSCAHPA